MPCSRNATHNLSQLTRSKALDRSKLMIQIGVLTANNLSTTKFAVNRCSSIRCPLRNPCCPINNYKIEEDHSNCDGSRPKFWQWCGYIPCTSMLVGHLFVQQNLETQIKSARTPVGDQCTGGSGKEKSNILYVCTYQRLYNLQAFLKNVATTFLHGT